MLDVQDEGIICGVQLQFEGGLRLNILVTEEDELHILEALPPHYRTLQSSDELIWSDAYGKFLSWFWTLKNQGGYEDGVQFEFGAADEGPVTVQLLALGGCIKVRSVK